MELRSWPCPTVGGGKTGRPDRRSCWLASASVHRPASNGAGVVDLDKKIDGASRKRTPLLSSPWVGSRLQRTYGGRRWFPVKHWRRRLSKRERERERQRALWGFFTLKRSSATIRERRRDQTMCTAAPASAPNSVRSRAWRKAEQGRCAGSRGQKTAAACAEQGLLEPKLHGH
jgi:hypothetical protein